MGSYSILSIGKFDFQWKYYLPPTLSFIFDKTEYFVEKEEDEEENYIIGAGYKTTVEQALERMQKVGYTDEFFINIYMDFFQDLNDEYLKHLEYIHENGDSGEQALDIELHLSKFPETTPQQDIDFFCELLIKSAKKGKKAGNIRILLPNDKYLSIPCLVLEKYSGRHYFDLEDIDSYLFGCGDRIPPGLYRVASLFEESRIYEYPDILLLFKIFIILKITKVEDLVILEYHELLDESNPLLDLKSFHDDMIEQLIHKVSLYNKTFRILLEKDSLLRKEYNMRKLSEFWKLVLNESDKVKKGLNLESFTTLLLDMIDGLEIVDRRLNNGDEEIDIVASNHLTSAFWISFSSPCILIECKNWSSNVGVKEIRDFEAKLRNHNNLCRIGLFISVNGFSAECQDFLKRMGRDKQILTLISGRDIDQLFNSNSDILTWLERHIIKSIA